MSQTVVAGPTGKLEMLRLPDPEEQVMNGVLWGAHYALFTPAYWAAMAWYDATEGKRIEYRIGQTLEEEVAACILGGYGIPAEVGWAAYYRLRDAGLFERPPFSPEVFMRLLAEPLDLNGRQVRYRFAKQKSRYLSAALMKLHSEDPPVDNDVALRGWLMELDGVGPKTASWITRNWLKSDNVAIIDIHIHRAGILMGLYHPSTDKPTKNYFVMEQKFLEFAECIKVKASILDALIWYEMKHAGSMALNLVEKRKR